jgi:uncharacterized membrane-anchored protein
MPRPGNETIAAPAGRKMANKLPQITVFFWIAKILTTGFGEAASDALSHAAGIVGVVATGLALAASLIAQLRATRYVPWLYWLTVALVGVFGTMAADGTHELGISLGVSSAGYLAVTAVIFAIWHRVEGTLSFAAITTRRREGFYWAAVLATFALGTAVGDLAADSWGLGNLVAGLLCVALILVPLAAHRWLRLGAVPAFWIAYVITRPLGASFADWMSYHGLHLGSTVCAAIWAVAFAALVGFLVATRNAALKAPKAPHPAPVAR